MYSLVYHPQLGKSMEGAIIATLENAWNCLPKGDEILCDFNGFDAGKFRNQQASDVPEGDIHDWLIDWSNIPLTLQ